MSNRPFRVKKTLTGLTKSLLPNQMKNVYFAFIIAQFLRSPAKMSEQFEVVKGIRFPKYSLKIVKYDNGEFGVIESFYFMKYCYKRNIMKFEKELDAKNKYEDLHASRKFDHMTGH